MNSVWQGRPNATQISILSPILNIWLLMVLLLRSFSSSVPM